MELLSPAGDWDALVAAVENGADAVYLGGKALNARRGAGNFDDEELKRAADYLHERGKRMYVTVNTLVKQDEMPVLEEVARSLAAAGADAAIVQDFGVSLALREMLPGLHLHASTQMAAHNRQGAAFLRDKGFERVVLARELTFEEIRACADEGVEIEVFCHGALCVACSGQCLFSSMVGGRSGNRGVCAQPCRLPYRLEGAQNAEGYLLSPKDLMTLDMLEEMRENGVTSLKIEGRLKRPEYVAVVTGIYRRALDGERITDLDRDALKQIFNRGGFTRGYAPGVIDSQLISVARPSHWGVKVGEAPNAREIRLTENVLPADAVVIRPEGREDVPVRVSGNAGGRAANPAGVRGDVMRLVSENQMIAARETVRETRRTVCLTARLQITPGQPARAEVSDGVRGVCAAGWTVENAERAAADEEKIRAQFSKTGGTPYFFDKVDVEIQGTPFVPASGLNALRRDALDALRELRLKDARVCAKEIRPYSFGKMPEAAGNGSKYLIAQGRNAQTLLWAQRAGADDIALLPKDVRDGALDAQTAQLNDFYLVIPPVLSSKDLQNLNEWAQKNRNRIRGAYLTNVGQLGLTWPGETRFHDSLSIANQPAAAFLEIGDRAYTPSIELSVREMERLGGRRELVVYGRVPLMHLRHCPLNAARGGGAHAQCRRCDSAGESGRLDASCLIDRKRVRFPLSRLATGAGCVIDVMNSVPLSLIKHARKLPEAVGWRLLFEDEDEETVKAVTRAYRSALNGGEPGELPAFGITTGHYFRPVE